MRNLLRLVILLGLPMSVVAAPGDGLSGRLEIVNLRAEPSTESAVVAKLRKGMQLYEYRRRNDWVEVGYTPVDGAQGWVYGPLLVPQAPGSATPTETAEAADRRMYVRPSAINLRAGPGTDSAVVTGLSRGQSLSVLARRDDWLEVDSGRARGWVYAPLLQDSPPAEPAAVSAPADTPATDTDTGITLYVRPPAINLRATPGTDTTVLGRLTRGQPVTLLVRGNGWLKVDSGALQGWVYAPLLQDSPPAEPAAVSAPADTPATDTDTGITLYVRPPAINLRGDASTSAEVLGRLQQGQGLSVLTRRGDWVQVRTQDSAMRSGWVYRPLLMSSPPASSSLAAGRSNDSLILNGDDNREATRLLLAFLQKHGFHAEERRGLAVAVKFDTETFILEPRITRDRLDRIIVAQLYSVRPSYRGASVVKGWVDNLGGNLNIGQFTLSPDGGRLLFQGNITFVDRLELLEITEYLDFLHQRLTRSILAVPGADIYLE